MEGTRLAELVGGLLLAADLANEFPPQKAMRTAVVAVHVGRAAGLPEPTVRDAYWTSLLRFLGCTAFAHEEGAVYGAGEDGSVRHAMALADPAQPGPTLRRIVAEVGAGAPLADRVRAMTSLVLDGVAADRHAEAQCEASIRLAELVGVSPEIRAAMQEVCERWDGKGSPKRLRGEALSQSARLLHLADVTEIAHHERGLPAAIDELRRRRGGQLDPRLVDVALTEAGALGALLERGTWETFLAHEPGPTRTVDDAGIDAVALAFAHFADLKSAYTLGHSSGVARLATAAASALGLDAETTTALRRAALLHDVGRVAVSNRTWDKPGPLDLAERERVRMHAYATERIVSHAPPLRVVARIAAAAHERLDGAGYHRAIGDGELGLPARILGAADVVHAMREPRAHRAARSFDEIARHATGETRAGRLDRRVVEAVLAATGIVARLEARRLPKGLSEREVEVLRLLARGKTNKEIGALLGISPRTVQNHVAHAYDKIGVYSRAGAALFVTEQGLL